MQSKRSPSKPAEPQVRVVVYVPKGAIEALKAKLAARGQSVSFWFRRKIEQELAR